MLLIRCIETVVLGKEIEAVSRGSRAGRGFFFFAAGIRVGLLGIGELEVYWIVGGGSED